MSRAAATTLALGLLAMTPAASWASGLELRLGAFFPRADSNLFRDDTELYTEDLSECLPTICPGVEKHDWIGFYGGGEFSFNLAEHVEMGLSVDGYGRTLDTSYRDAVRDDGSEIRQSLHLEIVPIGVSLRFLPLDRRAPVSPYLTVGADLVYYKYEEYGEFIDFFDDSRPVGLDSFRSDDVAFGGHVALGVRVPLGHDFALTAEGRYLFAEKKQMDDDFYLNKIDLNGASATIGVRLRF